MPLWGTEDTLEGKPKIHGRSFLTSPQTPGTVDPRTAIYATTAGWVQPGTGRGTTDPEVLVAIRGLSTRTGVASGFEAAGLAEANITSFNWNITTFDKSAGGTNAAGTSLSVTANFNETVTVTGVPKLVVLGTGGRNHNLTYTGGTTTSRLTFKKEIGAGANDTNAADVLTIGVNSLAQVGGSTIKDTESTNNAVILNHVDIGTAAGSITVVA